MIIKPISNPPSWNGNCHLKVDAVSLAGHESQDRYGARHGVTRGSSGFVRCRLVCGRVPIADVAASNPVGRIGEDAAARARAYLGVLTCVAAFGPAKVWGDSAT